MPAVWRKLVGYLAVIALFGCPIFLIIGLWQAVRYERTWATMVAITQSFIGTILAWGVTILYDGYVWILSILIVHRCDGIQ